MHLIEYYWKSVVLILEIIIILNFSFISFLQGGIKAVIWTDVIQYSIMVTSVLAILIKVQYEHF